MKSFLRLSILLFIFVACNEEPKKEVAMENYIINGSAPGLVNGIRVYLKKPDERGRFIDVDTAVIMNETFTFEGKVNKPEKLSLHINSVSGSLPFIIENAAFDVKIDKDNILNSKISGTKANDAMKAFDKQMADIKAKSFKFNTDYRQAVNDKDSIRLNEIAKEMQLHNTDQTAFPHKFVKENHDNYFSLTVMEGLLKDRYADVDKLEETFNSLSQDLRESEFGADLNEDLQLLIQRNNSLANLKIGKKAPTFSAPDPNGNMVSLDDVRGKATIIDFWAAWCGPCRRENPNVVRVYEKYHDKGLEIISVSLDGSSRQQDPKAAWLKAIEDDNLTWTHVSNLKYFEDPVAQIYNISSIPATYILDAEGKITAKNLRGDELESKIAEMLN